MTSQTRYGGEGGRPIRKDRLLIAGLIIVAAILVPILLKSGCTKREETPLTVTSDGQTVGTTGASAPPAAPATSTTAPAATTATTSTARPVDEVMDDIRSGGSTPSSTSATTTKPATSTSTATTPSTTSTSSSSSGANILSHTVKQGETLQSIATAMGVGVRDLRASNRIFGTDVPAAGRVLYAAKNGLVHTIKSGQTLTDIAATYGVTVDAIAKANGIAASTTIFAGARLVIPGVSSAFWDTVSALSKGKTSRFIWPVIAEVVSTFGWRVHPVLGQRMEHTGIDLDVPEGTTIYASAGGRVYFYGEQSGYGNVLILEHEGGFYTLYGHLKSALVTKGQYVEQGQKVALSGNTGISSGPHLHFEIRNGEFPLDPLGGASPFLP